MLRRRASMLDRGTVVPRVVIALALLLVAAAPAPQVKGLRALRVAPAADSVTDVARLRGFFAAEGLDVAVVGTTSSADQMRGLSDGTYDVTFTAFDNVLAWSGQAGAEIV